MWNIFSYCIFKLWIQVITGYSSALHTASRYKNLWPWHAHSWRHGTCTWSTAFRIVAVLLPNCNYTYSSWLQAYYGSTLKLMSQLQYSNIALNTVAVPQTIYNTVAMLGTNFNQLNWHQINYQWGIMITVLPLTRYFPTHYKDNRKRSRLTSNDEYQRASAGLI